jgi:hypothetical protein
MVSSNNFEATSSFAILKSEKNYIFEVLSYAHMSCVSAPPSYIPVLQFRYILVNHM